MRNFLINKTLKVSALNLSQMILVVGCCLICIPLTIAQLPDSLKQKPLSSESKNFKTQTDSTTSTEVQVDFSQLSEKFKPIPKKALLYSIIPGGGQIYNRRWWKLPFVYGALGGIGYFIGFNTQEYRRYRDAIRIRQDGDDSTVDEFTVDGVERISTMQLQSFRDKKRKDLELSYIFFFITYTLTSVEAFVDAHLQSFDVSDDLSLRIGPTIDYGPAASVYPGLGARFQLKSKTTTLPVNLYE